MIGIDIIRKKRNTAEAGGSTKGSAGVSVSSGGDAQNAVHADDADHANRADEATHAASAKELDGGSSVWNTIRTWISNAKEGLGDLFLRKDQDDATEHKLTMGEAEVKGALTVDGDATVGGKVVTDDIHSSDSDGNTSMTGRGWTLRNVRDETGSYSVLTVDNIVVRKKMEAAELEIHRKTYVGAQQIASDWGHKILRVDPMSMDYETGEVSSLSGLTLFTLPVTVDGVERPVAFVGRALSDTETRVELLGDGKGVLNRELETTANAFKVYFCESDGTASIEDDLVVGAMGQCQEFNVKERVTHNFTNTYYWGVCVKHGVEDNVMIGGKATKCVYGVFAHTTELITLTSEVSKKTFTCYGMEMVDYTFPVAGDDMVGFGCADPWQDADRCNAIITASKDSEKSAPSVIAYSGIGRMRGGAIVGTLGADAACSAYAGIGEQYSIPSAKDDSRLDFRVSKKAGNVFKGDLYFKGSDGKTLQPVKESETTSVWQLVPVTEKAEISYSINPDAYKSYQDDALKGSAQDGGIAAVNGSAQNHADAAAGVFVKKGTVNLQYQIVHQQGDGRPEEFSNMKSMPDGYEIAVTEFYSNDDIKYSCRSNGSDVGGTNLHDKLLFQDNSASDVAYVRVILYNDQGDMVDRREVRMKLNTNGVFEANRDFLAYIYYGTDENGVVQYTNQRFSSMQENYTELTSRMETAEGKISTNTQKITETAEEYKRDLEQEKSERGNAEQELQASIDATAAGIKTTVRSLYKEGNLLWGANVMGMFRKMFRVYTSETIKVKAGITYTLTVKAWMRVNTNDSQKPFYTDHAMRITLHGTGLMNNGTGKELLPLQSSGLQDPASDGDGHINRIVFTATEDTGVYVTIEETGSDANNPDPGAGNYGGVYVDWLRIDAGEHGAADKYTVWAPAAEDIETINLVPDPEFKEAVKMSSLGATREYTDGDVSYMSKYGDDYSALGCYGIRMKRTGQAEITYSGIRYYVPFRGAGEYTLSAFFKEIGTVEMDDVACVQVFPCGQDKSRTGSPHAITFAPSSSAPGYEQLVAPFDVADVYDGKAVCWFELRIFMTKNGDVVVNRISLAKCKHRIVYDSNSLSDENGRKIASESYAYQRADSMGAGIRQGLKSVGFRMDSANWTVNTWGEQFAWYATEADANAGTNAKMWLDTNTNTLHVKGYVEATGGTIGGLSLRDDGLYQGTDTSKRYAYYSIDSMYLRGVRADCNNNTTYKLKFGFPTVDKKDGSTVSYVSRDAVTYVSQGLNGVVEFVRTTKGTHDGINLKGGDVFQGEEAVYEGTNECALGVKCGSSGTGYGYGIVNIGMLATHRMTVLTGEGGSVTLQTEGYYLATKSGITITLPADPQKGARITIIQCTDGIIYINGNGKGFRFGNLTNNGKTVNSAKNAQWNYFLYDGSNWLCMYVQGGRLW